MLRSQYRDIDAIVIGASAGGVDFLLHFVAHLPLDCPCPIFIVIHQKAEGKHYLCDILAAACTLPLLEAEDKMRVLAGHVYIAPANYHLMLESSIMMALSEDELVHSCRPSIDVLFESAVDVFQCRLMGIILTGMGCDGAHGLHCIERVGGFCIIETPSSAQFPSMPLAAFELVPTAHCIKKDDLVDHLFVV